MTVFSIKEDVAVAREAGKGKKKRKKKNGEIAGREKEG